MTLKKDYLVLYIEEVVSTSTYEDEEETCIDTRCFVLFDKEENEYFISGKRNRKQSEDFKFYCKKRKNVYHFLLNLLDEGSKINAYLYNLSDIDDVLLNFNVLYTLSNQQKINNNIGAFYNYDCHSYSINGNKVFNLLNLLKYVRY